jgi:hypothetical protein
MARERWFYEKGSRRMGPLSRQELLQSLLALPEPRGCLIWRQGLAAWMPARDVPEIDAELAPLVKAQRPAARDVAPAAATEAGAVEPAASPAAARAAAPAAAAAARGRQPNIALYFGALAGLLAVVVLGWVFWPKKNGDPAPATTGATDARPGAGAASPVNGTASNGGASGATGNGEARPGTFAGWSDQEAEVTADQLRRLRGVGGWTGNTLTVTLYNGSAWRITEILVRTSLLRGDEFVDGDTPHRLLPAGSASVDAGMADLLNKVAPDRKKPGVNPLDTGAFEAAVGT